MSARRQGLERRVRHDALANVREWTEAEEATVRRVLDQPHGAMAAQGYVSLLRQQAPTLGEKALETLAHALVREALLRTS